MMSDSGTITNRLRLRSCFSIYSLLLTCVLQIMAPSDGIAQTSQTGPKLQLIRELEQRYGTTSVTWSSDGTRLAAYMLAGGLNVSGKLLTIWTADGRTFREIEGQEAFFTSSDPLVFVAGDKQLVTTPWLTSRSLGFLVFDVESGKVVREVRGPLPNGGRADNGASALAVSPDGSVVAVIFGFVRKNAVGLYSTNDWSEIAMLQETAAGIPTRLAFSRDGKLLAIGELLKDQIVIYDIAAKRVVQTFVPFADNPLMHAIALSPDGALIAIGTGKVAVATNDAPVRVVNTKDGSTVASFPGPSRPVFELAWSPDGRFIAFIADSNKLHLWNPLHSPASEQLVELTGYPNSLAFSPDGTKLAVNHGNKVAIFEIAR